MVQLAPRFFVLPLIALAVIVSLPRNADTRAAAQTSVAKTVSCTSSPSTPCVAAAASRSFVR
jgi:hypothetical protein